MVVVLLLPLPPLSELEKREGEVVVLLLLLPGSVWRAGCQMAVGEGRGRSNGAGDGVKRWGG